MPLSAWISSTIKFGKDPESSATKRAMAGFPLIVQDERQEVVLRIVAEVAGLVHKNREFSHAKPP